MFISPTADEKWVSLHITGCVQIHWTFPKHSHFPISCHFPLCFDHQPWDHHPLCALHSRELCQQQKSGAAPYIQKHLVVQELISAQTQRFWSLIWSRGPLLGCRLVYYSTVIIIMEICKVPTLQLKALNKHTHMMYIEMENGIKKQNKIDQCF